MNAVMDLHSRPGLTVFEVLQDVNFTGSFWCTFKPIIPEAVVIKPVTSGPGFERFIPGFCAKEFVLDLGH